MCDLDVLIDSIFSYSIHFLPLILFPLCLFCLASFLGAITKSKPSNYYLEEDLSNETNDYDISDKFDYINDLSRYSGGEQYLNRKED